MLHTLLYTTNLKPEQAKGDLKVADPTAEDAERAIAANTVGKKEGGKKNDSDTVLRDPVR